MISLFILLLLVWIHFFADFICQSDKMAQNKSKSIKWLSIHSLIYTLPFLLFGWKFSILNGLLHFGVDYTTSKINKQLWENKEVHWFFVGIGADQAVHMTLLILTYIWLF